MAYEVVMPQMGADMKEGTLIRWLKNEGDEVKRGEAIAEIETDKANIEIEAFESGIFRKALAKPGDVVAVGQIDWRDWRRRRGHLEIRGRTHAGARHGRRCRSTGSAPAAAPATSTAARPRRRPRSGLAGSAPDGGREGNRPEPRFRHGTGRSNNAGGRRSVSAGAGVGPGDAPGSSGADRRGRAGRSDEPDAPGHSAPNGQEQAGGAALLRDSRRRHDGGATLRSQLNAGLGEGAHVSVNDLLVKASAKALQRYPVFNTWIVDEQVQQQEAQNVCIAIALDEGLIAPAILDCGRKSVVEIAQASRSLAERSRSGALKPDEFSAERSRSAISGCTGSTS